MLSVNLRIRALKAKISHCMRIAEELESVQSDKVAEHVFDVWDRTKLREASLQLVDIADRLEKQMKELEKLDKWR